MSTCQILSPIAGQRGYQENILNMIQDTGLPSGYCQDQPQGNLNMFWAISWRKVQTWSKEWSKEVYPFWPPLHLAVVLRKVPCKQFDLGEVAWRDAWSKQVVQVWVPMSQHEPQVWSESYHLDIQDCVKKNKVDIIWYFSILDQQMYPRLVWVLSLIFHRAPSILYKDKIGNFSKQPDSTVKDAGDYMEWNRDLNKPRFLDVWEGLVRPSLGNLGTVLLHCG